MFEKRAIWVSIPRLGGRLCCSIDSGVYGDENWGKGNQKKERQYNDCLRK